MWMINYYISTTVQQNHDGLPQKAGFPQECINEIHGAWYDPSNTVVPMNGCLRDDLFADLLEWEQRSDLTLSIGTSMCGMNSDRIFTTPANKSRRGLTIGGVIIGIQRTQHDHLSCLRIFAKIDDVLQMVLNELGLYLMRYIPLQLSEDVLTCQEQAHRFQLPYDTNGVLLTTAHGKANRSGSHCRSSKLTGKVSSPNQDTHTEQAPLHQPLPPLQLDLAPGAVVKITSGPYAGDRGEVLGCTSEGHYRIRFRHVITNSSGERQEKVAVRMLGLWWIQAAVRGSVPTFPVVNCRQHIKR
jgi:hypothetical protein